MPVPLMEVKTVDRSVPPAVNMFVHDLFVFQKASVNEPALTILKMAPDPATVPTTRS